MSAEARERMVDEQIAGRGVRDARVLRAMRAVPRERFVPSDERWFAYEDRPLPIGYDATISQPYIVALMAEALEIEPEDRILDIGGGSGYAAAVLAELGGSVVSVEVVPELVEMARENLAAVGSAVEVIEADGWGGHPGGAPYDAINVAAAARVVPTALIEQLADGGRMVIPVDSRHGGQDLVLLRRHGDEIRREIVTEVRFVPLVGSDPEPPPTTSD